MKKLTALLLAVLLVFGLAACAGSPAEPNAKPGDTMTLQDILTSITKDVADLPDTETTALTKDNFEYFAFTAMPDGVEAIAADALINAVPHSVVLMRAQDAETAKKLAADVEANLNRPSGYASRPKRRPCSCTTAPCCSSCPGAT